MEQRLELAIVENLDTRTANNFESSVLVKNAKMKYQNGKLPVFPLYRCPIFLSRLVIRLQVGEEFFHKLSGTGFRRRFGYPQDGRERISPVYGLTNRYFHG